MLVIGNDFASSLLIKIAATSELKNLIFYQIIVAFPANTMLKIYYNPAQNQNLIPFSSIYSGDF